MHTVTSSQVKVVIENFAKVLHLAEKDEQLDMGSINAHKCKTAACHAGWYLISIGREGHYGNGSLEMANSLGFAYPNSLKIYFCHNPELWGNSYGTEMFCDPRAFTPGDKTRADNLKDIYDHWCEVHDRIYLQEQLDK